MLHSAATFNQPHLCRWSFRPGSSPEDEDLTPGYSPAEEGLTPGSSPEERYLTPGSSTEDVNDDASPQWIDGAVTVDEATRTAVEEVVMEFDI